MNSVIDIWVRKHAIFLILFFLWIIHLLFLTKLPVFNDEAIYLDWGWRETHVPGFLFYSLYDAKQPLLMWVFGIAESIYQDPLFAGRFVSVSISIVSFLGIYKLSLRFLNKKYSVLSSVLFASLPVLFFYNRQALMEGAMICVGIWIGYYTLKLIESRTYHDAFILGLIAGTGYFIKSTTLIFLFSSCLIIFYSRFRSKDIRLSLRQIGTSLGTALCIDSLLFLQPSFWQTLGSNTRYVLTPQEIFTQSISLWVDKVFSTSEIVIVGLTPVVFLFGVYGMRAILKNKETKRQLVFYFIIAGIIQLVSARSVNSRYLIPFLGIYSVFSMVGYYQVIKNFKLHGKVFVGILLFILPVGLSLLQVVSPRKYLELIPLPEHTTYLYGQTSGYGVKETVNFLRSESNNKEMTVGVALQSGNPESSVIMYFQKDKKIHAGYFDSKQISGINEFDCIITDKPTYFVSRNEQLVGFDKFLTKVKTIHQAGNNYSIGVYKIKSPCMGKAKHLYEERT